jgi:hypothetical protein
MALRSRTARCSPEPCLPGPAELDECDPLTALGADRERCLDDAPPCASVGPVELLPPRRRLKDGADSDEYASPDRTRLVLRPLNRSARETSPREAKRRPRRGAAARIDVHTFEDTPIPESLPGGRSHGNEFRGRAEATRSEAEEARRRTRVLELVRAERVSDDFEIAHAVAEPNGDAAEGAIDDRGRLLDAGRCRAARCVEREQKCEGDYKSPPRMSVVSSVHSSALCTAWHVPTRGRWRRRAVFRPACAPRRSPPARARRS